ncbi:MAG: response regulator [Phycisphaerales bacterium]|nr:MAG: response regulator [Phycisphaerales bacterium]
MDHGDSQPVSKTVRINIAMIVLSVVMLLICVIWSLITARQYLTHNLTQQLEVQELAGTIKHYDEILTMSARMAAATGDLSWEERYHRYEPALDEAINAMRDISPQLFDEEIGQSTDEANQRLVAKEVAAFDAIRKGDRAQAEAILFSQEYEELKVEYASCMERAATTLTEHVQAELALLLTRLFWLTLASFIATFLLASGLYRLNRDRARLHASILEDRMLTLQAGDRAKSAFLANMSHEIRTPMTAILGYTELLGDPKQDEEQRRDALQIISRNGQHLLSIVNDILDLSKIEAGKLTLEKTNCSPIEVLNDVITLMQVRAESGNVTLKAEYELPLPREIESDPLRLRQILINIIGNAIKFAENGAVSVRMRYEADGEAGGDKGAAGGRAGMVCFEITDTGIGMSEEQAAQLFTPFTQADNSSSRRFGGTGLGLTISRRLARLLGGDIEVVSQLGQGSAFTVRIAARQVEAHAWVWNDLSLGAIVQREREPVESKPESERPSLSGRILLVEDGPDNQRLIRHHLEQAGADVTIVEHGRAAVDLLAGQGDTGSSPSESDRPAFDLILMDMQMPVMDGYEATRTLRANGYDRPILALTANAMAGDREKCLAAGCDEHLPKPIDRAMLLKKCAQFMRSSPSLTAAWRRCPWRGSLIRPAFSTPGAGRGPRRSVPNQSPETAEIRAGRAEPSPCCRCLHRRRRAGPSRARQRRRHPSCRSEERPSAG